MARTNNPDEHSPWAIIIIMDPQTAQLLLHIIAVRRSPIWPTDEYAIRDLISDWRRQIMLVTMAPIKEILISSLDIR